LPDEIVDKFENYNLDEWITLDYVKSKSKALVGIYSWLKTLVHFTQANKNVRKIASQINTSDIEIEKELKLLTKLEKKLPNKGGVQL